MTFLCAWVLLCPCGAYAFLGDAPLIAVIAAGVLLLSTIIRRPIPLTVRTVVYSLTIASVGTVILDLLYPVDGDRFFMPLPTEVVFPFLITVGVCATFLPQTPQVLGTILTCSVCGLMVQGSCLNDPVNVRMVVETPPWTSRFFVFGIFLAVQMAAFLPLLNNAMPLARRPSSKRPRWAWRLAVWSLSTALLAALVAANCMLIVRYYRLVEAAADPFVQMLIGHRSRTVVFTGNVDLNRTISSFVTEHEKQIVLRVRSEQAPGYLRGFCYHAYAEGRWALADSTSPLASNISAGRVSRTFRYPGVDVDDGGARIDIFPSGNFHSDALLATGNTASVELIADALLANREGVLQPREWEEKGGYSLNVPAIVQHAAFNSAARPVSERDLQPYLRVPELLRQPLQQKAARIFAGAETELDQVRRIESYMTSNFDYQLGVQLPADQDPVIGFLDTAKAGHCELFATAAVLLLRSHGVPSRYVTGFVCLEAHPLDGHWIARTGDCHAWAEAYLREEGRWVLVEPTPASGIPLGTDRTSAWDAVSESLRTLWTDVFTNIKRGYFATAIVVSLGGIGTGISWIFWYGPWYVAWPLLIVAVILLLFWRRRRRPRRPKDAWVRELQRVRSRLEHFMARHHVHRQHWMSIGDFIRRIDDAKVPYGSELTALLTEYEALRYAPSPPSLETIDSYARRVTAWISGH